MFVVAKKFLAGHWQRLVVSLLSVLLMAPITVVFQGALKVWGVLDPISTWLGGYLQQHVSPEQAGWTIASIGALVLYLILLAVIWHHSRRAEERTGLGRSVSTTSRGDIDGELLADALHRQEDRLERERHFERRHADLRLSFVWDNEVSPRDAGFYFKIFAQNRGPIDATLSAISVDFRSNNIGPPVFNVATARPINTVFPPGFQRDVFTAQLPDGTEGQRCCGVLYWTDDTGGWEYLFCVRVVAHRQMNQDFFTLDGMPPWNTVRPAQLAASGVNLRSHNEEQLPDRSSDDWEPLTPEQSATLRRDLKNLGIEIEVYVACSGSHCRALAKSFLNVFSELGWRPQSGSGGFDATGWDGIGIYPSDTKGNTLKTAIEKATPFDVRLPEVFRGANEPTYTVLVIGAKPFNL